MPLLLEKWYGDWIDASGPNILYKAALRAGSAVISFEGGHMASAPGAGRFTLDRQALPHRDGSHVVWPHRGQRYRWDGASSRPLHLADGLGNAVEWDVLVPAGRVTGPGLSHGAIGYAERLVLRVAPWRLGIKVLRWGRFCGRNSSLTWVQWLGEIPVARALLNGRETSLETITAESVTVAGARLDIEGARLFVDARLGSGLLQDMPWPRRMRPLRFLAGHERKYVGRGQLRMADGLIEDGDVLFEDVLWDQ